MALIAVSLFRLLYTSRGHACMAVEEGIMGRIAKVPLHLHRRRLLRDFAHLLANALHRRLFPR